jgi:hypothetical protein
MEIADHAVDGLDVPPFGAGIVGARRPQDLAGLRRQLLRQGFPDGTAKYDDRYAGEYCGCCGRTRDGTPLTGGDAATGRIELRLIGQADKQPASTGWRSSSSSAAPSNEPVRNRFVRRESSTS